MRPAARDRRDAAADYNDKTTYEISHLSKLIKERGHPGPLGDPTSGVVILLEQPVGPRVLEALQRSLEAVELPQAYVTYESTGLLAREILAAQPQALVAIGPGAARDIDAIDYPLARQPFSDAEPGTWFPWTRGTAGLALPALAPALSDAAAKRRFWRAFLSLRDLVRVARYRARPNARAIGPRRTPSPPPRPSFPPDKRKSTNSARRATALPLGPSAKEAPKDEIDHVVAPDNYLHHM